MQRTARVFGSCYDRLQAQVRHVTSVPAARGNSLYQGGRKAALGAMASEHRRFCAASRTPHSRKPGYRTTVRLANRSFLEADGGLRVSNTAPRSIRGCRRSLLPGSSALLFSASPKKKKGPGEVTRQLPTNQHVPDAVARPLLMKPSLHRSGSKNNVYFARPRAGYSSGT
jgi:hypothetical protein